MPTFRVEKSDNFTMLDNGLIDDRRLSYRAKGLLITMLRKPDDWDFTLKGLTNLSKDGKDAVRTALEELTEHGYVQRDPQEHDESGRFTGGTFVVYEIPFGHRGGFPDAVEPSRQIRHGALKNNYLNNQDCNNQETPKAPKGGKRRREARKAPDYLPDLFVRFWALYPRGEDKQGAMDAWDELKPDEATIAAMSAGLHRALATEEWQRGIGIPYAVRWIRRRRWEDELKSVRSDDDVQTAVGPEVSDTW